METIVGGRAARRGQVVDALLEATLQSRASVGFAATTTRGVAELALGRTHPDTAAKTAATLVAVTDRIVAVAHHALPSYRARADFREIVLVAVGVIRDAATVGRVPGTAPALPTLPAIRRAFLQALDGSAR